MASTSPLAWSSKTISTVEFVHNVLSRFQFDTERAVLEIQRNSGFNEQLASLEYGAIDLVKSLEELAASVKVCERSLYRAKHKAEENLREAAGAVREVIPPGDGLALLRRTDEGLR